MDTLPNANVTRILFDAHQLGRRQTGNETYVRELLRALRGHPDFEVTAAIEAGQRAEGVLAPPVRLLQVPSHGIGRLAAMTMFARRERVDVVHSIYFRPPTTRRPSVVTIHDISFEFFPQFFSRGALVRDRTLVRASARAATRVITVSETSRRDLIQRYGLPEERVVAIPNGVGPQFRPASSGGQRLEQRGGRPFTVLAVGTLQPRKNLLRLVDALSIVARRVPIRLRVVGPDGHQAAAIRERLTSSVETDVVGWLDDDQLAAEYRSADLFVYPSIYEGFGLPVVEAMASGTPVVTTTGGSLPEVAGDAAIVVEPHDVAALATAIERVLQDRDLALLLRERGLIRASSFSWQESARRHLAVYDDLVAQ